MRFLRSNTAVIITVGPFYDKASGVDIEGSLTITNERITLTADTDAGSAPTVILDNVTGNDLNYISGNDAGLMQLELAAADVNRVGRMFLSITDAANHVPVFHEFMVLPQAIYDWLIAGTIVPVPANVTQFGGAAGTFASGRPEVNASHAAGTAWNSGAIGAATLASDTIAAAKIAADAITAAKIADGAIDAATFAAGAINAAAIAADAITDAKVASDVTIASVTGAVGSVTGAVGSVTGAVGSVAAGGITAASFAANAINAAKLDPDVTTELQAGLATAAALAVVDGIVDDILVDTGTTLQAELDGIQADTEDIQARLPAALVGGRINANIVSDFSAAVATDGSNSATSFKTTLTQTGDDHWKDAFLRVTSGDLLGQVKKVSAYNGTTKFITVIGGFTATPADAVTFDLVNE
jgi:hypothetical protein